MKNIRNRVVIDRTQTASYDEAMREIEKGYGPIVITFGSGSADVLGAFLDEDTFVFAWAMDRLMHDEGVPHSCWDESLHAVRKWFAPRTEEDIRWAEQYVILRSDLGAWNRLIKTISAYQNEYANPLNGHSPYCPALNNWTLLTMAIKTGEYRARWDDHWEYDISLEILPIKDVTPIWPEHDQELYDEVYVATLEEEVAAVERTIDESRTEYPQYWEEYPESSAMWVDQLYSSAEKAAEEAAEEAAPWY